MRALDLAIGVLSVLCLVTSSADIHAQAPTGNEFIVNAYTTGSQLHSSLAMGPDGSFLVFWDGLNNDGSVYGRRFDAAGTPVGSDFQVNQFATLAQSGPTAAPGADGTFIVARQSETQDGDRSGIFGRRYDANGAPIGGEFQVNTYTTDRQAGASIGSGPDGRFVVMWSSWNQDGDYWGVFGQRFDAAANRLGGEFSVNQFAFDYQWDPSVAVGPDGGFVVAWDSYAQDGSGYGVFARRCKYPPAKPGALNGRPLKGAQRPVSDHGANNKTHLPSRQRRDVPRQRAGPPCPHSSPVRAQHEGHDPGTVKLWESPRRSRGFP